MPDDVFINGRAAVYQGSQGQSVAFPDVCLCPPTPPAGPVPTPLPNTVKAPDLTGGAHTVLVGGKQTGKRSSYFAKSTGNEVAQSTGGGVVSHTVQGKAYFQSFSSNVFVEGEPAVRHLDMLTHNHLAQPGNTPPAVWLSAMVPPASGDPGPPNLAKKPQRAEGQASIRISVVDELGHPAETPFKITTPKGQTVTGRLRWGGTLSLGNLTEGSCRLVLSQIDERCRRFKRQTPATPGEGQAPYKPGAALDLATGKSHRVVVPAFRTLWVEIPRAVDESTHLAGQRFTLKSDDGQYRVERTQKDDKIGAEDLLTLAFPGVHVGPRYALVHSGDDGQSFEIFSGQPFESLFPNEDDLDGPRKLPVHRAPGHPALEDEDE